MKTIKNSFLAAVLLLGFVACSDDDTVDPTPAERATFQVNIENVLSAKPYLQSGTLGFLGPGESTEFTFNAGKGTYLSFATMFVQSNDLFYGFSDRGLRLYDDEGNAVTGDVTGEIDLWDAGTEVNEEPGLGPNQAPRQGEGNTGVTENGTVELISNVGDGYTYPEDETIIRVSLSHDGGTLFTALLENISASATLPSPLAPGVWAVHGGDVQLFTEGATAPDGLEGVAEDGNNTQLADVLISGTGYVSPFAPGVWAVHGSGVMPLFSDGSADKGQGLEALAEDGDPGALNDALTASTDVTSNGVFNTPSDASSPGPLLPGASYSFTFEAVDGDYLSLATMLVHTNDLFYGFEDVGIALFNNGTPVSGDFTADLLLWDAGTEVNEYPGAGNYQPARGGGDSGPTENGTVRVVDDGFTYPSVSETIRLTITAMQ